LSDKPKQACDAIDVSRTATSTVRYLGIEVYDALSIAEQVDL
jgi:hypothetical protein